MTEGKTINISVGKGKRIHYGHESNTGGVKYWAICGATRQTPRGRTIGRISERQVDCPKCLKKFNEREHR